MLIRKFGFIFLISLSSCEPQLIDDPIPFVPFDDFEINLNLPEYFQLKTIGGSLYVNSIGVRGVIVYRKSSNEILAFERNCSYQPANACATVEVHSSSLFLEDVCCRSHFNFDGQPSGGPAWRPLRQYITEMSGSLVVITDDFEF